MNRAVIYVLFALVVSMFVMWLLLRLTWLGAIALALLIVAVVLWLALRRHGAV